MREVVVDTNVFVSALVSPHSPPRILLTKIASGELGLVVSPRLLLEIVSVFSRPKLRLLIPESRISDLVSLVHQSAKIVKPDVKVHACRDPKDNVVLECALAGKVRTIVTGDQDLLILDPFRGIRLLPPAEFVSSLKPR